MATDLVERAKSYSETDGESRETAIISPTDQLPMVETVRAFRSQDGQLTIYKTIGNRMLSEEEVGVLVTERQIGPLDGFRSKAGRPFSAMLRLKEDHKVEFVFGDRNGQNGENGGGEPLDPAEFPTIGVCPKCGGAVKETPNAFACEHQMNGSGKCDFRFSRTLLGQTLPTAEAQKLLSGEKTSVLDGFKSKRTGRNFSAQLFLKPEGGLGFEFPPRAPRAAGAKGKGRGKGKAKE
jgi:DNA topoisomerase III